MPRTAITAVTAETVQVASMAEVPWVAADVSNGNKVTHDGKQQLLMRNVNNSSPLVSHTVTLHSLYGTSQYSLAGGKMYRINPLPVGGYKQSGDSSLWFEADSTEVEFAVVNIP